MIACLLVCCMNAELRSLNKGLTNPTGLGLGLGLIEPV